MNRRPDKLEKGCPYTRVEYLENLGWSRVFLPVYPKAGDVVVIESELSYTDVSFRQSELAGYDTPWFFWGVYDTPTWYAGGTDTLYSQHQADTDWHIFKLVSLGADAGLWVDDQKIIDIKQYPDVVYAPQGIELWSYSNGRRNSLNRKKWLRITINGKEVMHLLPVLDAYGVPALYDSVSRQLFYNIGEDALAAGPVTAASGYTPLEYIEGSGNAIGALQAYITLPVEMDLRSDSFAFETEHELFQGVENQAEGLNVYNPMLFYGMRTNGAAYYGVGYGNAGSVADGAASILPGYSVFRAEYDKGETKFIRNGSIEAYFNKGIPKSEMVIRMIGVFCAVGKPVVDTEETGNAYPFNGRKKYFKVWVNEQLVVHLVAAEDAAGIPCMYDLVNSRFYYSEGEADFIAGPVLGS